MGCTLDGGLCVCEGPPAYAALPPSTDAVHFWAGTHPRAKLTQHDNHSNAMTFCNLTLESEPFGSRHKIIVVGPFFVLGVSVRGGPYLVQELLFSLLC